MTTGAGRSAPTAGWAGLRGARPRSAGAWYGTIRAVRARRRRQTSGSMSACACSAAALRGRSRCSATGRAVRPWSRRSSLSSGCGPRTCWRSRT
eukprot:3943727-Prymnesium_polylepis.1